MVSNSFELAGRRFTLPAGLSGINPADGQRLVTGLTVANSRRCGGDLFTYDLTPGAVDLERVRSGRCPLLLEHCRTFENLLGVVVDAWVENGTLLTMARLTAGGWADRAWAMLEDGLPLSTSTGASIIEAEEIGPAGDGGTHFRVTRWSLDELSLVVFGNDPDSHVTRLDNDPAARARLAERAKALAADRRQAVHAQLHLDRWERWTTGAGVSMAEHIGADRDLVCDALRGEVDRHVAQLVADLAA
jgi:hypothetical protein